MDTTTRNHERNPSRIRLRIAALSLALAALPAIGAHYEAEAAEAVAAVEAAAQSALPEATTATDVPAATLAPATTEAVDAAATEPEVIKVEPPAPIATLEPGEYLWHPEVADSGPVVVVVSLPEQRAHVYRNGLRIGVSTISSGKPGHETPTGTYPILQKRVEHYSNLYDNAPMPYMQRLTWDGIALHAGRIPGYPASHGCVRLPHEFAELLFDVTSHGTTVVVADESSHSSAVVYPGARVPVDPHTGMERNHVDVASLARAAPY